MGIQWDTNRCAPTGVSNLPSRWVAAQLDFITNRHGATSPQGDVKVLNTPEKKNNKDIYRHVIKLGKCPTSNGPLSWALRIAMIATTATCREPQLVPLWLEAGDTRDPSRRSHLIISEIGWTTKHFGVVPLILHVCVCACACVCMCIYIYTIMYKYIYIYIYTECTNLPGFLVPLQRDGCAVFRCCDWPRLRRVTRTVASEFLAWPRQICHYMPWGKKYIYIYIYIYIHTYIW